MSETSNHAVSTQDYLSSHFERSRADVTKYTNHGFCLFVLALLLLSALSVVVLVFVAVALALGSILALVLLINLCLSVFITFSLANTYMGYRIAVAGYKGGVNGARLQIVELYTTLFYGVQASFSKRSPEHTPSDDHTHDRTKRSDTSSPDSTVIINSSEIPASGAPTLMGDDNPKLEEQDY
ncbi:hypothetical protein BT96DRAFT_931572 [Gymnopus androsaceus JB14]|uniref:Uncharacterized protein n=1 Tax=Gymnopus androsaceus JB14 TaxID=1447944 RepID=A0A6A4IKM2_9AGAR|nr:hypothetical protein BT96DRAFT_931572 [Gymnopus androsaceus JB14]